MRECPTEASSTPASATLAGGTPPHVDAELAPRIFRALYAAIQDKCVRSCHDLSEGGLAVAAAEMAFAGGLGLELDLKSLASQSGTTSDAVLLFSESNTRFLVEIPPEQWTRCATHFTGLPLVELGRVTADPNVTIRGIAGDVVVDANWNELKQVWKAPLAW